MGTASLPDSAGQVRRDRFDEPSVGLGGVPVWGPRVQILPSPLFSPVKEPFLRLDRHVRNQSPRLGPIGRERGAGIAAQMLRDFVHRGAETQSGLGGEVAEGVAVEAESERAGDADGLHVPIVRELWVVTVPSGGRRQFEIHDFSAELVPAEATG